MSAIRAAASQAVKNRPTAVVQVDVDSYDVIARAYGLPGVQDGPDPIIARAMPVYLQLFASFGVRATFFVVGRDLENEANLPFLAAALEAGHRVANHSYSHSDFAECDALARREEVARAHEAILDRLGVACSGFKAPCYATDPGLVRVLEELGYAYDSSMIATVISPVVKTYYRLLLRKPIHPANWGYPAHLLSPRDPYRPSPGRIWRPGGAGLLEIPVTTMPLCKFPIHFSMVNILGSGLFKVFDALEGLTGGGFLNYAFHLADLVPDNALPAAFYARPGLRRPLPWREEQAREVLRRIVRRYALTTGEELAGSRSGAA
ncbi:Peptidoglycan deacetylase [Fundidesulfovibrio magnetotacticus]|uniref:Peptidoglycan deacetylase n=1 Tax=Fundidesulfovibrio magnetotacticus TaxID=2730080 RepID=A0A6V8LV39_9BACT|nr:polysaccharide deacetylase family protein [Fundidesulfovibrio magnetotacticus]GFK94178.1 Peptidoglycan deacetylase [Fundidesulfovibrio magnetotacticus]